jgi:hypothetical protein
VRKKFAKNARLTSESESKNRRILLSMKRRDVIKYVVASVIALLTVLAIAGMTIAKYERRARSQSEEESIRETFQRNGLTNQLPEALNSGNIPKHDVPSSAEADAPDPQASSDSADENRISAEDAASEEFFAEVSNGMVCPCDDCDDALPTCGCSHAMDIRKDVEQLRLSGKSVEEARTALLQQVGSDKLDPVKKKQKKAG